jgi:hypothetical protein
MPMPKPKWCPPWRLCMLMSASSPCPCQPQLARRWHEQVMRAAPGASQAWRRRAAGAGDALGRPHAPRMRSAKGAAGAQAEHEQSLGAERVRRRTRRCSREPGALLGRCQNCARASRCRCVLPKSGRCRSQRRSMGERAIYPVVCRPENAEHNNVRRYGDLVSNTCLSHACHTRASRTP